MKATEFPAESDRIDFLLARLREMRETRGWSAAHDPRSLAVSLSVEVGELLEHYQWGEVTAADRRARPDAFRAMSEELADVVIFACHLADSVDLDLLDAVHRKIDANQERFPRFGVAA